jgi:hypothetical protein
MIPPLSLLFLILLSGSILQVSAQQAPSRKEAGTLISNDRGLLLGMYFPKDATHDFLRNAGTENHWISEISPEPHGSYITFWISRRNGEVTIKPIEGLLVPRKDGFWRIGSHTVRSGDTEDADFDEQFWAAPADQKELQPRTTDSEINGKSSRLITYAGPDYISYIFHWQGGVGLWEYQFTYVSPLESLTKQLSVAQVLGPQGGTVYKKLSKSLDHMNDKAKRGEDMDACNCCTGADSEWGLIHVGDRWQTYARFHEGSSSTCSQGWQDQELRVSIPQGIWSGGRPERSWDALRKEIESVLKIENGAVQHLFLSPKEDVAVSVSTAGLAIFEVKDKTFSILKKQEFAAPCIPVSEEWSTGRFVAAWDAEMQKQKPATISAEKNP